ncbi:MAG: DUF1572 family protein [Flavobacteriales bacterium]|nr:DUF1572 family protein [Bacteroidota bacterium]MCB9240599.1 DUF1572 family protein [Flavobacteriales bacterium]
MTQASANNEVVQSLINLFRYYQSLGEKAMKQTEGPDLFTQHNEDSNSVATMVKHLWGNMRSRWTDFLTSDGEKDWRERDAEFENDITDLTTLWTLWEEGWNCLYKALEPLNDEDLTRIVYIRNQGHTVLEAIHRQLGHYAYHVGQIVYRCKMISDNWQSLSIARGKSTAYNQEKFSQDKHREHFSNEFTKKP